MASSRCLGGVMDEVMALLARLVAVLVTAQKIGGDFFQPISNTKGATRGPSPFFTEKTTPSFGISSRASQTR